LASKAIPQRFNHGLGEDPLFEGISIKAWIPFNRLFQGFAKSFAPFPNATEDLPESSGDLYTRKKSEGLSDEKAGWPRGPLPTLMPVIGGPIKKGWGTRTTE